MLAKFRIKRFTDFSEQTGETSDRGVTARRALVNIGLVVRNGTRIIEASRVRALCALCLREPIVDRPDFGILVHSTLLDSHSGSRTFVGIQYE